MSDPKAKMNGFLTDEQWSTMKGVGRRLLGAKLAFGLIAAIGGFLSVDALYTEYIERQRIPRIVKAFERGSTNLPVLSANESYFPHVELEAELSSVIAPANTKSFNLITGAHGTGKTTCVKQVCRNIGSGIIYVYLSENNVNEGKVHEVLARQLDMDLERRGSFWSRFRDRFLGKTTDPEPITMRTVATDLQRGSLAYYQKHNKATALVIDNITVLGKAESKKALGPLIELAKEQADAGTLTVTFVASEGNTPRSITADSRSSRLGEIIEVGDLSDDEGLKYLANCSVGERDAKEIIEIAGGRMQLLQEALIRLEKKQSISSIRKGLIQQAQQQILAEHLSLPEESSEITLEQVKAWKAIIRILDSPTFEEPMVDFFAGVGKPELADLFLRGNVFAFHPQRYTVGLRSRPMGVVLSQIAGKPGSKQREELLKSLNSRVVPK